MEIHILLTGVTEERNIKQENVSNGKLSAKCRRIE